LERFAESLRAKAEKIEGFKKYLEKNPKSWAKQMRSRYEDDKRFNGEEQPVVGVTWFAAVAYAEWLNELHRATSNQQPATNLFRLPNEEEWEWAASGGKRKYPWAVDKEPDETRANYGDKVGQTTPVGTYPAGATPEGVIDMAGNVWEWCENLYGDGAVFGEEARALRGGSWAHKAAYLPCSIRLRFNPGSRYTIAGFRVVCVISPSFLKL
jgi:formylglycine-generating enzyme required for sulfatase activity